MNLDQQYRQLAEEFRVIEQKLKSIAPPYCVEIAIEPEEEIEQGTLLGFGRVERDWQLYIVGAKTLEPRPVTECCALARLAIIKHLPQLHQKMIDETVAFSKEIQLAIESIQSFGNSIV